MVHVSRRPDDTSYEGAAALHSALSTAAIIVIGAHRC